MKINISLPRKKMSDLIGVEAVVASSDKIIEVHKYMLEAGRLT